MAATGEGVIRPSLGAKRANEFLKDVALSTTPDVPNVFADHVWAWWRYVRFLQRLLLRFDDANNAFIAWRKDHDAFKRGFAPVSEKDLNSTRDAIDGLRLEAESFYLFAKILLDRVADSLAYYVPLKLRGAGSSHKNLIAAIEQGQAPPLSMTSILPRMKDLQHRVVEYRNEWIEHLPGGRYSLGFELGSDGKVRIVTGGLLLSSSSVGGVQKRRTTENLYALYDDLDHYIIAVVDFLEANRARTILKSSR
jgi:hypothetical protein